MARYRVKINTDSYKCKRCSKKNWEPGTMNDYMLAINGITRTIYTKRELFCYIFETIILLLKQI